MTAESKQGHKSKERPEVCAANGVFEVCVSKYGVRSAGQLQRKLAACVRKLTSAKLAKHNASNQGKLFALQLFAGFLWGKPAMRAAGSKRLAIIAQRSLRMRTAAELATRLRAQLHEAWHAPPCLAAKDQHPWWELIASSGMSSSATELEWNKVITS